MPLAALVFGLLVGGVFRNGYLAFASVILALAFGFGLSIFSIVGGFRRQSPGTLVLGIVAFVFNGGCLYYIAGMCWLLSNLHC